jgi:sigma-B regulation protein RsbU (phosphoserine phosphatase)
MNEPPRRQRILVVDDDPGLQHVVSRVLGKRHEVRCASSPAEAIVTADKFHPQLAILDIYMPEMNGFELMRSLRSQIGDLDVIIMTGDTAEADANLIRAIDDGAFYYIQKPFERRVLLALVSRCLELRRLRAERQRHVQRLERELADARRFQQSFLPPPLAESGSLRIAARYLACQELAGDFYDYAFTPDGAALLVADVVGHGASAAMMTGVVKAAFHTASASNFDPAAVIAHLKESLRVFDDSRFVTVFCARLDLQRRSLEYINAGHPPAILRREGSAELLEATGPLVSPAFAELPYGQASVSFYPGDRLFVYTDGLAEASGQQEMFGHARIRSLVAGCQMSGAALLERMLADLSQFVGTSGYDDDVTLLALDCVESAAAKPSRSMRDEDCHGA